MIKYLFRLTRKQLFNVIKYFITSHIIYIKLFVLINCARNYRKIHDRYNYYWTTAFLASFQWLIYSLSIYATEMNIYIRIRAIET